MDAHRPMPREQIQKLYQRWIQLKQQYGEQVAQNPEFIHLSKMLKQISKQQEHQRRMQQVQPDQSPIYQQQQHPPQQVPPQQSGNGFIGQGQTPQPAPPQVIPQLGPQQHAQGSRNPVNNGLFAPYQSMLLKAQIAAFKCLVKNIDIPPEVNNILIASLKQNMNKNPLDNVSISQQGQHQNGSISGLSGSVLGQTQQQPSPAATQITQQQHAQSPVTRPSPGTQQTRVTELASPSLTKPQLQAFEDQAPMALEKLQLLHPDIKTVIPVTDPRFKADSFTLPIQPTGVSYDSLLHPKSRVIIPGVTSTGIDINGVYEMQEAEIQLKIASLLDDFAQKLDTVQGTKRDNCLDDLIEYYSLKLLPLQKAIRGHVLSFNYFTSSLLTNTHPNFLAKNRRLNLGDADKTNSLYLQQQSMKVKIEHKKKTEQVEKLTSDSSSIIRNRSERRYRIRKFGKSIINMHTNIEKEEQKRVEKNAKQRLQALKANDEEAYIKLLDQTKDTRITHLLKQTNQFLDSLAQAVKEQQKETHEQARAQGNLVPEEFDNVDEEDRENIDYYSVAHRVKEEVKVQPSILVGGTLKEYQLKGLQWMVSLYNNHLNGILADEMGLGKTIQTLSLITYLIEVKKVNGPFLVIVPLSTLTNWNLEFEKWAPVVKKITYKGTPNVRKTLQGDIRSRNFQVLLTTFEYIIKDRPLLCKINWAHMIIDEGHRMKNANSKLSLTLAQYYHTDYRLILTGTPLQNNLPELWALLNFVLPKIFNSVKSFDEWFNTPFANTGGQDKIELSEEETLLVIRRLHKVLRPFLLRRLKKDVEKDLPNKVEKVIKCKMSAIQSKMYQHMLKYHQIFVPSADNTKLEPLKGFNNPIMQLRKICNHPFVFEEIEDIINPDQSTNQNIWRVAGKFELLERVLPKFKATGHRVLIFFQMTQIMDIMEDFLRLNDMKYLRLDGSTKADDRTDLLKLFNAPGSEYFAFLLSTRAGGLGLNLQTADTVIIFDTDWNPHQDLQAQDRAHRIGQKNEVRILRLITEDSVEEVILERAHQKLDIDGKVIQAGKFDNKSTAEEQEALLRELLEAEESKKSGKDDDDDLDDDELNEILSRNEDELKVFQLLDDERKMKKVQARLFTDQELPSLYSHDPSEFQVIENVGDYGRGARERKQTFYDDNISEETWLREIEGIEDSDEFVEDADDFQTKKKKTKKKKRMNELDLLGGDTDDQSIPRKKRSIPPVSAIEGEDGFGSPMDVDLPERPTRRGVSKAKGAKKSSGRGRHGTPANRLQKQESLDPEARSKLTQQCFEIYNELIGFVNEEGRVLSEIFKVKPPKKYYPDYYVLIKNPIALDIVFKRINTGIYQSLKDFIEDLRLIFGNAKVYNEEGSMVYNDAQTLEDMALAKYRVFGETDEDFGEFDAEYMTRVTKPPPVDQMI